ncbi:hypothetical protein V5O48_010801 [Marasmius crinis-equi]|uniref:CxC1-like cysteine cluster associated with KDZ transposases domain-containing protein n=1 Tax=Marasmius crinis-equi TaxID=585013 RepID=A0ABR3F7U3_9AGAR
MSRPRVPKRPLSPNGPRDYSLIPTRAVHATAASRENVPLLLLADGRVYTQDSSLPSKPGQVGLRDPILGSFPHPRVQSEHTTEASTIENDIRAEPDVYEVQEDTSAHRMKRNRQSHRWRTTVIPQLVYPYMELLRTTDNLYDDPDPGERHCTCGGKGERTLDVTVVRFHRLSKLSLVVCECTPAAVQLIQRGLFPSAPTHPTLAVDIRVLEFVKGLFLRVAPNHRAWCETVTEFLGSQGYRMKGQDPLRRRFSNALQWFSSLKHATKGLVNQILEYCREERNSGSITDNEQNDIASRSSLTSRPTSRLSDYPVPPDSSPPSSRPTSPFRSPSPHSPGPEFVNDSSSSSGDEEERTRKRPRVEVETPPLLDRPSEYLRSRCPLCFGGSYADEQEGFDLDFNAIVCIDACFTQKHNRGMGQDPLKTHPESVFMSEEEVKAMEDTVESIRPRQGRGGRAGVEVEDVEEEEDGYEGSMKVPRSTLDGCEASFTAADERREKASTKFFDCTALMALLCRHDRVLWIANMTSAGERQHYVLALLEKLFQHLPNWFRIGLLYDIGCQLHRSCVKWEFLDDYIDRIEFAISVFHAFGHHWPCQLIYHPRKRIGFGLSDGEGCERFWHSISRLIPYLRVCGYYQRLYTLDCQVEHAERESLQGLGLWISKKRGDAAGREWTGQKAVQESGHSTAYLREQWELQKQTQTQPLPKRSSQRGKKAVQEVLRLRESFAILKGQRDDLERAILDVDSEDWEENVKKLPVVKKNIADVEKKVRQRELLLGVEETQEIRHLTSSPYLRERMNALALKARLVALLRSRKFQRDRLERSFRKQINEAKIHSQIAQSVKRKDPGIQKLARSYNEKVSTMERMVASRKAPRNAVPPKRIPMDQLFSLDVDDEIWQDVGLTDEWDTTTPPPWLADDSVRSGIRGMLDVDRSQEELLRLRHERNAMQYWFSEEWAVLGEALERTDVVHQLLQKKRELLRLCCRWQRNLGNLGASEGVPDWGPSAEELRETLLDIEGEFLDHEGGHEGRCQRDIDEEEEEEEEDEVVDCDEDTYNTVIAFDTVEGRDDNSDTEE